MTICATSPHPFRRLVPISEPGGACHDDRWLRFQVDWMAAGLAHHRGRGDEMAEKRAIILIERIEQRILLIRGQKVLLDSDLAAIYGVTTRALNQAVKRNPDRFPDDFTFRLAPAEVTNLRSQSVTSSSWGGRRVRPYAFTEQGVAILSSVLRSERAVQVNVASGRCR